MRLAAEQIRKGVVAGKRGSCGEVRAQEAHDVAIDLCVLVQGNEAGSALRTGAKGIVVAVAQEPDPLAGREGDFVVYKSDFARAAVGGNPGYLATGPVGERHRGTVFQGLDGERTRDIGLYAGSFPHVRVHFTLIPGRHGVVFQGNLVLAHQQGKGGYLACLQNDVLTVRINQGLSGNGEVDRADSLRDAQGNVGGIIALCSRCRSRQGLHCHRTGRNGFGEVVDGTCGCCGGCYHSLRHATPLVAVFYVHFEPGHHVAELQRHRRGRYRLGSHNAVSQDGGYQEVLRRGDGIGREAGHCAGRGDAQEEVGVADVFPEHGARGRPRCAVKGIDNAADHLLLGDRGITAGPGVEGELVVCHEGSLQAVRDSLGEPAHAGFHAYGDLRQRSCLLLAAFLCTGSRQQRRKRHKACCYSCFHKLPLLKIILPESGLRHC